MKNKELKWTDSKEIRVSYDITKEIYVEQTYKSAVRMLMEKDAFEVNKEIAEATKKKHKVLFKELSELTKDCETDDNAAEKVFSVLTQVLAEKNRDANKERIEEEYPKLVQEIKDLGLWDEFDEESKITRAKERTKNLKEEWENKNK